YGNFDAKDEPRSGQHVTDKVNAISKKVEQDRYISSYDITEELETDHKTVLTHLKKRWIYKYLDTWIPHELTERIIMNELMCDFLLKRNETELYLKRFITGDEKWITYDKNVRKRSPSKDKQAPQTIAKPGLTRNKLMPCIW
ncbi:Histone-lysine N-methyltransferase SETMAR, partial [Eumeta japonica]